MNESLIENIQTSDAGQQAFSQCNVMRRFNYLTEARNITVRGIREHKTFPAHMKDEAVSIIQTHFEAMGKMIAAIELTYLRSQNGA